MDQKKIDLLELMIRSRLIDLPMSVSTRTRNIIRDHYKDNRDHLRGELQGYGFSRIPGAGPITRAEACYWVIYDDYKCPRCGK